MPSWDDFRVVKAVADRRSRAAASKLCGLTNQPCFESLTSKTELDARLFKRGCAALTLTVRGEEAVCFAARMERDVAAFERGVHRRRFDRSIRLPKIKRAAAAARLTRKLRSRAQSSPAEARTPRKRYEGAACKSPREPRRVKLQ